MLILGVFLHASEQGHWSEWVTVATRQFRMEAFFLISGMMTVISYNKKGGKNWLKIRLIQLGVPLLFMLLVFNQLSFAFDVYVKGGLFIDALFNYKMPLIHAWFLLVLLSMNVSFWFLNRPGKSVARSLDLIYDGIISDGKSLSLVFAAWLVFSAVVLVMAEWMLQYMHLKGILFNNVQLFHRAAWDFLRTVPQITFYAVYFSFGVIIMRYTRFLSWMIGKRRHIIALSLFACVIYAVLTISYPHFILARDSKPFSLEFICFIAAKIVIGPLICGAIVVTALQMNLDFKATHLLARAGYTIYVCHIVVIYAIHAAWRAVGAADRLPYVFVVLATILSVTLFHHLLVNRSRALSFILNGKVTKGNPPLSFMQRLPQV